MYADGPHWTGDRDRKMSWTPVSTTDTERGHYSDKNKEGRSSTGLVRLSVHTLPLTPLRELDIGGSSFIDSLRRSPSTTNTENIRQGKRNLDFYRGVRTPVVRV